MQASANSSNQFHITTSLKTCLLAGLLAIAILPTVGANAQDSHVRSLRRGDLPISITTILLPDPKNNSKPVSETDMADAVLGDVLRNMWEQADAHWHKGEYSHIVNLSRIIVQGDPRNLEAFENSSWLLWSMQRNDEAVALLKQGIQFNPDNYSMYDELGTHYSVHLKKYQEAIPYYEKAIKFRTPFSTWNSLALCYYKTKQLTKAIHTWEIASKYPNNDIARVHLQRAKAELAKQSNASDK